MTARPLSALFALAGAILFFATASTASAASYSMSSTVLVPTPTKLNAGQMQYASYAITAGTTPAKVTVEWYRVINPRLSADFDSNREVVVPERSLGNAMTGGDTYVIPANAVKGQYGVLFRYYAQAVNTNGVNSYTIPGNIEATSNNSFYIEVVDVCPNISGAQPTIPSGYIKEGSLCKLDVCPNMAGAQEKLPAGHGFVDGNCRPDICPNLLGVQTAMPPDHARVGSECLPDVCDNFEGVQTKPLPGLIISGKSCVEPAKPEPQVATPVGVVEKPILQITKKGSAARARQGQRVKFAIRVQNKGKAAGVNVKVCDLLPAGMVYVTHTGKAVFERNGRVCWTVKRVPNRGNVLVGTLTVSITKAKGVVTNRACIMKGRTAQVEKCAKAAVQVIGRKPQPTGGVTG